MVTTGVRVLLESRGLRPGMLLVILLSTALHDKMYQAPDIISAEAEKLYPIARATIITYMLKPLSQMRCSKGSNYKSG